MRLSLAFLLGASSLRAADTEGITEKELMKITATGKGVVKEEDKQDELKARLFITDKRDPTVKNDTRNWLVDLVITDKNGKGDKQKHSAML